jgi:hypothetical protein
MPRSALTLFLAAFAVLCAISRAPAQNINADEAVGPDGGVGRQIMLTAAQRSAIYNAVLQQRVQVFGIGIPAAVGAPVPPTTTLAALPDAMQAENAWSQLWPAHLKYAMVEDDVLVVDTISMRVVDVIHRDAHR